jgi:hypothetical protein
MSANTQRLLNTLSALMACLCREAGIDSYDLMTSSLSLIFKDGEERTPTGVHDGFGQVMVLDHIGDLKVFYRNMLKAFSVWLGRLKVEVPTLPLYLEMGLGRTPRRLTLAMRALLASAHGTLLASQGRLTLARVTGVVNGLPLRVSQKRLEPDIKTDIRMRVCRGCVCSLWNGLAHDKRVPVVIGSEHKVNRLRRSFQGAMHLGLRGDPTPAPSKERLFHPRG